MRGRALATKSLQMMTVQTKYGAVLVAVWGGVHMEKAAQTQVVSMLTEYDALLVAVWVGVHRESSSTDAGDEHATHECL